MKMTLTTSGVELDEELEKYAERKVQALEKYIPRAARESAHAEVRLKRTERKGKPDCTCDITLRLPKEALHNKESTGHLYAAIDIATAHLHEQILKYKATHHPRRLHLRHRAAESDGEESEF